MVLKNKLYNQFQALIFHFVGLLMMLGVVAYFEFTKDAFLISGIIGLLYSIPVIYLHLEYLYYSRGSEITIDEEYIIIKSLKTFNRISRSDIKRIIFHKHTNLDKGGIQLFGHESYNHIRLVSAENEDVIITCFMIRDLQEVIDLFSGVPVNRTERIMCAIRWD